MALFTSLATSLIGAGIIAGTAAAGVAGGMLLSGSGKQSSSGGMQMPEMPSAPKMQDASKNAKLAADERRRAAARSDSVQTNPLGLRDEDKAQVARKRLLGG